jgi:ferredoxin
VRVAVDRSLCESNALCVGAAPAVFDLDDDDLLIVLDAQPSPDQQDRVRDAVGLCPKQALSITP